MHVWLELPVAASLAGIFLMMCTMLLSGWGEYARRSAWQQAHQGLVDAEANTFPLTNDYSAAARELLTTPTHRMLLGVAS